MRGYALLLGTCLTLAYGFAAQAAMVADRNGVVRRLTGNEEVAEVQTPVWYGGTLAPITVQALGPASSDRVVRDRRAPKRPAAAPSPAVRLS